MCFDVVVLVFAFYQLFSLLSIFILYIFPYQDISSPLFIPGWCLNPLTHLPSRTAFLRLLVITHWCGADRPRQLSWQAHTGLAIVDAAVRREPSLAVLVLLFSFINDRYQSSASHSRAAGRVHAASPPLHENSPVSPEGGAVIRKDRCMITSGNSCALKPNWQCWGNYSPSLAVRRDAPTAPVQDLPAWATLRSLCDRLCRPPHDPTRLVCVRFCAAPRRPVSPRPCRHWQARSGRWWDKMFTAAAQSKEKMFILVWSSESFWARVECVVFFYSICFCSDSSCQYIFLFLICLRTQRAVPRAINQTFLQLAFEYPQIYIVHNFAALICFAINFTTFGLVFQL